MEVIDLTTEIEAPKTKAKAKAKAKAEPTEAPKAKAKPRAKPKAKAVATDEPAEPVTPPPSVETEPPTEPLVDVEAEIEPPTEPPIEPVVEPTTVEAETTTRKPKGHRPKIENKEKLTKKVNCKKCDKTVSLHSIKYTHDKFCNKNETPTFVPVADEPAEKPPPTLRQKLEEKRLATAQRLISQCFKS